MTSQAGFLVPSQVRVDKLSPPRINNVDIENSKSRFHSPKDRRSGTNTSPFLVPSQVMSCTDASRIEIGSGDEKETKQKKKKTNKQQKQQQPSHSKHQSNVPNNTTTSTHKNQTKSEPTTNTPKPSSSSKQKQRTNKIPRLPNSGNYPDINWRAIPMEHLRLHPNFIPLPPTSQITHLNSVSEVNRFRQDSWQWNALHAGRMTTSHLAIALGFMESKAAKLLGVPPSLRKGGIMAYHRLKGEEPLVDLEEMNRVLIDTTTNEEEEEDGESQSERVWSRPNHRSKFPFAAKYLREIDHRSRQSIHSGDQQQHHNPQSYRTRMQWGMTQEPTAILTALNYFCQNVDSQIRIKEIGMCAGPEHLVQQNGLVIGASPDAVILYPNHSRIEALEVKNHCPFVTNHKNSPKWFNETHEFRVSVRHTPAEVAPWYVPQLMMEMACLGPECRSAIMVRQTATKGAVILRLHRDDDWIEEMLHLLKRFKTEFVDCDILPPKDFFWDVDAERYRDFVQKTKDIGSKVELVARLPNKEVQRVKGKSGLPVPLFFDRY